MNINEIKDCLFGILSEMGIYIKCRNDQESDIDLTDFISNSIDFISFFIEIEDAFEIELPDELLGLDNIRSLNAFSNKILLYLQDRDNNLIHL